MYLNMKDRQIFEMYLSPSSLDFMLTPISIYTKDLPEGAYHLQLQKGLQHIKIFPETIYINNNKQYTFQDTPQTKLTIHNSKYSNFSWSLYRQCQESHEYIDLIELNIGLFYKIYTDELKKYLDEFVKIMQEKNNLRQSTRNWKTIKANLKNKNYFIREASNKVGNIKIRYTLQIRNQLDYLPQKQQAKCQITTKASLQSVKSAKSSLSISESQSQLKHLSFYHVKQHPKSSEQHFNATSFIKQNQVPNLGEPISKPFVIGQRSFVVKSKISQDSLNESRINISSDIQAINMEQRTVLSDIIQNSHEGSTILNVTNLGEKSEQKKTELLLIQQEPLVRDKEDHIRNTFHSSKSQKNEVFLKRTRTYIGFSGRQELIESQQKQEDLQNEQADFKIEQNTQKQEKQIFIESDQRIIENEIRQDGKNSAQTIKSALVVLIILLLFIGVVSAIKPYKFKFDRIPNKHQRKASYKSEISN